MAIVAAFATVLTLSGDTARATVGGPTCNVPADYSTIQAAVNDPGCSTINVLAGAYAENVTINRPLTLNGARMGTPAPGRVGPESIVSGANPIGANAVILVNAADVTIDGFTLKNSLTTGAAIGITVRTTGNKALITNNIIDTITTLDTGGNGTAQAIYLQNGPDDVRILANDMKNVQSARSAKGVLVGDNGATNAALNLLIQGNSISNITSNDRGSYGISVANATTGVSGLKILDNTITNLTASATGWIHAVGLEGNTPSVVVDDNSISNFVTVSPDAVAVWFESNPSFGSGQVNENNFNLTAAAYGIAVQSTIVATGAVNGTCNWWGAPDGPGPVGPGAGAKVSPRVTYTPWLTAPTPVGACIGGASTPGKVTGGGQIESDPFFSVLGDLVSLPALIPSLSDPSAQASFGFVVQCCQATGNLEYNDKPSGVRIKATSFTELSITAGTCGPNTHATMTGTATVIRSIGPTTDESLTVEVDDCGHSGDMFGIRTDSYMNGPSTLIGGNIQIH
jgi:hypothetical protein